MISAHLANILIHAGAGLVALVLGFFILGLPKGTNRHRQLGRLFCYFTLGVCASAITGLAFFRFMPTFALISLLVLYQLVGGWRSGLTQARGPAALDAVWTALAIMALVFLAPYIMPDAVKAKTILYSTFGALAVILTYDTLRFFFPHKWHQSIWRYEHSYKLLSALFGMASALVGNVVRVGQPWSQLIPSAIGVAVILYFFIKLTQQGRTTFQQSD